jgi:N-acetyl-1-D-myo-inositol-2-amino-2-deoxy-alpha-D-glucopyranoside deacetylase
MSMQPPAERRLLLVHAHPDDETIGNGVTMARYAAEGAHVTLVTCTRGEEGEILVPELAHLGPDADDTLGIHRETELADAMAALGVTDHRFLGERGELRDSGMAYDEAQRAVARAEIRPDTFWAADLRQSADRLVKIIRELRPQVLVTYDENGAYGHPDHIQAHRVAMYAMLLAGAPSYRLDLGEPWAIAKVYWNAVPRSGMERFVEAAKEQDMDFFRVDSVDDIPFVVPDELVTTEIDGHGYLDKKMDAMRAHATQISVDGPFFALSNQIGFEAFGMEFYRLVHGDLGPVDPASGRETDLFAGVDDADVDQDQHSDDYATVDDAVAAEDQPVAASA